MPGSGRPQSARSSVLLPAALRPITHHRCPGSTCQSSDCSSVRPPTAMVSERVSSSGVALIISLHKRTQANGGAVKIAGIRDQPRAIFKLLRYDKVFDL